MKTVMTTFRLLHVSCHSDAVVSTVRQQINSDPVRHELILNMRFSKRCVSVLSPEGDLTCSHAARLGHAELP